MEAKKLIATRDGFGEEIVELGRENHDIYVVDIDIGQVLGKTGAFARRFPGACQWSALPNRTAPVWPPVLPPTGKIPFVVHLCGVRKPADGRTDPSGNLLPHLNVKIACSHGGLTPANDGASHQGIEDMGVLRTIPNMRVVMPADYYAARALVRAAAEIYGPVYLRFTRDAIPVIYNEKQKFEIGKAITLREGGDVAIIANGRHRPACD